MLVCKPCKYYTRESAGRKPAIQYCPQGHPLERSLQPPISVVTPTSRWIRLAGILIDFITIAFVCFVLLLLPIPIISQEMTALAAVVFWSLRDINGRSPGKAATGSEIVNRFGGHSTSRQRIIRNLPFSVAILPLFIPIVGYADFPIQGLVFFVECMFVLITAERLGDKLAGTVVIRQGTAPVENRYAED